MGFGKRILKEAAQEIVDEEFRKPVTELREVMNTIVAQNTQMIELQEDMLKALKGIRRSIEEVGEPDARPAGDAGGGRGGSGGGAEGEKEEEGEAGDG